MKQQYLNKKFRSSSLELIATVSSILNEYIRDGYSITVRSLYYQLVARGYIPNNERSYKNITNLVSDARLAGLLDWDAIEDRMRAFKTPNRWANGSSILNSAANSFHMDMWADQESRVFSIIEKDALSGVISRSCNEYDIPMLAARGYPSSSVIREFVKHTLIPASKTGQRIVILHMGDHDPSGLDMSRDLEERINMFFEEPTYFEFRRLALNMDQVEEQKPPPNPAKTTDSRFQAYRDEFGDESWELDALSPKYINDLLKENAGEFIDWDKWDARRAQIDGIKQRLREVAKTF